jgi:hypothetical protein
MHNHSPFIDDGIVLVYGTHTLTFKTDRIPDRVYTCVQGVGGASCGTAAQGDYALVDINDEGFTVNVVVHSNSAELYLYDWHSRDSRVLPAGR